MFVVSDDLLKLYKQSIGDLNANGNPLDDYYKGFFNCRSFWFSKWWYHKNNLIAN